MKVTVIGACSPDSFADNIASGLRGLGLEVTTVGAAHPRWPGRLRPVLGEMAFKSHWLDENWQGHVARKVLSTRPDVVISTDARLSPSAVATLRRHRTKSAMWFPDHVANLGRMTQLAADYDVVAFKDSLLVRRLQATYCTNVRYLPEACNPTWHRPPVGVLPSPGPIVVAGNLYVTRQGLLRKLHYDGVPLRIFGNDFPRWSEPGPLLPLHTGEYVTRERKAEVFRSASAVLNNLHPAEMDGVNARLFEAAGCGAVVLTEYRPALAKLFADDEVMSFANYEQLLVSARAAVAGELPAQAIGDRASARAHHDHSYTERLRSLLEWLS